MFLDGKATERKFYDRSAWVSAAKEAISAEGDAATGKVPKDTGAVPGPPALLENAVPPRSAPVKNAVSGSIVLGQGRSL